MNSSHKLNLPHSSPAPLRSARVHAVAVLFLACPLAIAAQSAAPPLVSGSSPVAQRMESERLKALADQRQQKLQSDADKLLELAQQLKVSVDKTNKNTLSVQVVREAENIEKLARQVKEGMRQ